MILKVENKDIEKLLNLALILYQSSEYYSLKQELINLINNENNIFFLYIDNNEAIAFCHCSIRFDYVEGSRTTPVAYLEGIYVDEKFRKKGIAKQLLNKCENWAKSKNCSEFASDCILGNNLSLNFHLKNGFKEANKIIHFIKNI